ncbi:MAG: CRISPR-associated endoribonuclease Cas6 [Dethiobacteria bacterium]|jgi:CRISPR-associated endoribonuclease Cas6
MQLTLTFDAPSPVELPVHYSHLVQGMIYHGMENPLLRSYLHEHGFQLEKRRFKLFTFSRLMGQEVHFNQAKKRLILTPPLQLVVCSPIPFILQELGTGFLRQGRVRIGPARLTVKEMTTAQPRVETDRIGIRMLSPMAVYSTLPTADGRKYTYYFSPFEPKFSKLTGDNLLKKHLLIHGGPPLSEVFSIRPLQVTEQDHKVTRYKNFIVKGWMGTYELLGDPALLQIALTAGLGAKNSQGYGCCTLLNNDSTGEKVK